MLPPLHRSVWIHAVLITRRQSPWITSELETPLRTHIQQFAQDQDVYIDCLHGTANHLHVLFKLPATQLLADWMFRLKGSTKTWMQAHCPDFQWEADYAALSVSVDRLPMIRRRLMRQTRYHKGVSLARELWELNMLPPQHQCMMIGAVNPPVPGPGEVWTRLLAS